MVISIHAPPRGATSNINIPEILLLFQFTPLREGRLIVVDYIQLMRAISIHAPPRGATGLSLLHIKWRSRFQFTPLREGRRSLPHIRTDWKPFQFTPLREGRR